MPSFNMLQPALTDKERKVLKEGWTDWTNFMESHGLKPYEDDDVKEAKQILEQIAANDDK
ncbi:hypothetical protein BMF94_4386 [Rhodotorula taiwanensis]|uniref:Uncharacterized protein n=1 Tax=Rhodotorula taiwanensis TaxID=741276 RepID=A0A2S5B711_9BASI|nr:hypothetical protein BMF94_4386 [Rhodotorula taiwanensis]